MAVIVITIGGAAKSVVAKSLNISMTANGRATAAFSIDSIDGAYRPAQDAEVVITENGTTIFGGLLEEPKEVGIADGKGIPAIRTKVSAADFNVYAERRYVNATLAAGTLKSMLTTLVGDYLDDYGVSLHGSQVDGPTLPDLTFNYTRLDEVLNELGSLTAEDGEPYAWRIDHSKVLRMFQPSTNAAPFDLTGDPIAHVVSDIEVDTSYKHYANRVIVKVPSKMLTEYTATFTGDGSEDTFTVPAGYTIVKPYGYVENGASQYETLGPTGDPDTPSWEYDIAAGTVTRTAGAPANGTTINFKFDANYSGEGIAFDQDEIDDHGIKEIVKLIEEVPDNDTAQAIADGILAKSLTPSRSVRYRTHTAGILPGQSQSVVVSRRNLNGTAVISDVVIRDVGKDILERSVTAFIDGADTNLGRGFRDVVKKWAGDIAGGAMKLAPVAAAATPSPIGGGPALPLQSVQFNDELKFGGHAGHTFDKDTVNRMLGLGHAPGGNVNDLVGANHSVGTASGGVQHVFQLVQQAQHDFSTCAFISPAVLVTPLSARVPTSRMVTAGTIRNLRVIPDAAPGSGKSVTLTLYKNGSPSALAATLADSATAAENLTDSISLAVDDEIRWVTTLSNAPVVALSWSYEFEPTSANNFVYGFGGDGGPDADGTADFISAFGGGSWFESNHAQVKQLAGVAGTITGFTIKLDNAPGSGKSRTFNLVKNGTVQDGSGGTTDTTLTIADTDADGTATFSLAVTANDEWSVRATASGTPAGSGAYGQLCFDSDAGELLTCGDTNESPPSNGTTYQVPLGSPASGAYVWTASEAQHEYIGPQTPITLSGLRLKLPEAPSSTTLTFTLRVNNADTPLTLQFSGSDQDKSTTAGTVTIGPGDTWAMKCTTVGTIPTTQLPYWCFASTAQAERNLLTGYQHEINGSDSVIAGRHGTLTGDRSVLLSLDGGEHDETETGALILWGNLFWNGAQITSLGGAPVGASYVTLGTDGTLTSERVLTGSARISVTDGGAGTTVTLDIPNDGVTYAKIQNVSATSRLLGRASSGAGDIEELTLGMGLAFSGTSVITDAINYEWSILTDGSEVVFDSNGDVISTFGPA